MLSLLEKENGKLVYLSQRNIAETENKNHAQIFVKNCKQNSLELAVHNERDIIKNLVYFSWNSSMNN